MENNNLPAVVDHPEIMTSNRAKTITKELISMVKELGWSRNFGGERDHLEIDAWQFLAAKDGATPSIKTVGEIVDKEGNFIGFEATAQLLRDGDVLSEASHECTKLERNWANKPRYALRGMAQTRAMSRVCRNRYSWIARMGGFSGTPADEMDAEFTTAEQVQEVFPDSKKVDQPPKKKTTSWDMFWKSVSNAGYKEADRKSMNEFIAHKSETQKISKTDAMLECAADFNGFIAEWDEWKK